MRKFKSLILIFIFVITFAVLSIITADQIIDQTTKNQIYNSVADIPYNKVGLVLGTSKYIGNTKILNPYFKYRIYAAYKLYKAGKVKYLLVSGDNRVEKYNEPECMKNDLIQLGVPEEVIFSDFAGRRTLDSVIRAKDIFGLESFTIVSQQFHNKRAVYLANELGCHTVAYNAQKVTYREAYIRNTIRESLARVKAVMDVMFDKDAAVKGEKITLPQ